MSTALADFTNFETVLVRAPQAPRRFPSLLGPPPAIERRIFSDQALQSSIDSVLASLPADVKAAEVKIGGNTSGAHVVGVFKTPGGWSVLAGVSWDKTESWGGSLAVRKVWR